MLKIVIKTLFASLVYIQTVQAISVKQVECIKIAYQVGKQFKLPYIGDIRKTLASIVLQESSACVHLIGDIDLKANPLNNLYEASIGAFQIRMDTAKFIYDIYKKELSIYSLYFQNDIILFQGLYDDILFGANLTAYYFKYNYERALRKRIRYPYRYAISRHNGDLSYRKYFNRIMKRMDREVRDLIKEGVLQ